MHHIIELYVEGRPTMTFSYIIAHLTSLFQSALTGSETDYLIHNEMQGKGAKLSRFALILHTK